MLQAKLVVVGGDAKAKEISLKLPSIIGRGHDATLTLPHALVSRLHCQITERDGRLFVKDLGSLNGTFIDNYRIEGEQPLLPDQLLTLGTITFRACYELPAAASASGAADQDRKNSPPTPRQPVRKEGIPAELPAIAETWRASSHQTTETPHSLTANARQRLAANEHKNPPATIASDAKPREAGPIQPAAAGGVAPTAKPPERPRIAIETPLSAEKSICLESLEGLPKEAANASFTGAIDSGDSTVGRDDDASSIHVDAEEAAVQPLDNQENALVSFIKKLPR